MVVAQGLDLTPRAGFKNLEGANISILKFAKGSVPISYQPPAGWAATGGPKAITLRPTEIPEAEFCMFVRARAEKSPALGSIGVEDLQKLAAAELPGRAEDVAVMAVNEGPFTIAAQASREVVCSFSLSGRKYQGSVALVDFSENERLVMIIHARPADFARMRSQAVASLFSWQQGG